jgi:hypothetical protein
MCYIDGQKNKYSASSCLYLDEPNAFADAFANHFQSVYNIHCPVESPPHSQSYEFLPLAIASYEDVIKAIKRLKPSKSVWFNDTHGLIIKSCSGIFVLSSSMIYATLLNTATP